MSHDSDPASAKPFLGLWRISSMEMWDQDAVDLLGPGHFTFGDESLGNFRFVAVAGDIDARFGRKDEKPFVEFCWSGGDDDKPASGRGLATIDGDLLTGKIFIHRGDDSAFTATKELEKIKRARVPRGKRGS